MSEILPSQRMDNDPDPSESRKAFVPLENNPEVMSALVHRLGLSTALSFHDVFSIEDPEFLAFVPRPATALLLVFPISKSYEAFRIDEDADKTEYMGKGDDEPVVWYKQTIRNACGLIGILHAVSNGSSRGFIETSSDLDKLINDAIPLGPIERANLLYNSRALESAHQNAASQGQSSAPNAEDHIDLHYVCFVKDKQDNLWEMDGRRKGPLNRGKVPAGKDVLSDQALDLGVRNFLQREEAASEADMRFSLIALAPIAPADDKINAQAEQFVKGSLDRDQLDPCPLTQFHRWFTHAQSNAVKHPETVCLSTASLPSGCVSARMVYLKELDSKGFVIYSNFGTSKKARDLASNKWASLTFWWPELERQVRIEGRAERLTPDESQIYYDTRIRGSRIGAWASRQSEVLQSRDQLEASVRAVETQFQATEHIPVPPFWGGLRVVPHLLEFWQGRESRLHDRFQYTRLEDEEDEEEKEEKVKDKKELVWKIDRLSP